jgi:hypothetical protein
MRATSARKPKTAKMLPKMVAYGGPLSSSSETEEIGCGRDVVVWSVVEDSVVKVVWVKEGSVDVVRCTPISKSNECDPGGWLDV